MVKQRWCSRSLLFQKTLVSKQARNYNSEILAFPEVRGKLWHFQATIYLGLVGGWGRSLLALNDVEIHNRDILMHHIYKRQPNTPLITVCNHTSMLDDPALMASLVDWKTLLNSKCMRWSLAAKEICFSNRFFSYVCSHGKVIPVVRGEGVYQAALGFAIKCLNEGQWIHVFPEGKVTTESIRLKWGVGRMISECLQKPIVLPFYHLGMDEFLPSKKPYFPRVRKKITVLFGEPIYLDHVLQECKDENYSEVKTRKLLTDVIQKTFAELKIETEKLHQSRLKT